jgi:asparagine synthase (glutamine-hydrolysing)
MCGLVGLVSLGGDPIDELALDRASHAVAHRGPDDAGVWLAPDRRAGLAHRRLAILDVSAAGHQPFAGPGPGAGAGPGSGADADDALQLVFNGEIYNFLELRAELVGLGHAFRSRSDTEVVLHAYQAWGPACVRRFRGMFAFAVWDGPRRQLFLARDRLGIKPLYLYRDEGRVAFASELKALEAIPGLDLGVDETALYDFLTYLYVPTPKTPYARVRKLPAAHTMTVDVGAGGRETLDAYWDVDFAERDRGTGRADPAELRDRLADAVRAHLVSDVPVGSLLSGGVDSSCVTVLAQREQRGTPLHTFSVGFDVEHHSETAFARRVAELVGSEHTEETVALSDAERLLPRLGAIYDEPFGDSSAIPTFIVSQVARRRVKVALSGDGGDEVFGGYGWYARHRRRARFAIVPDVLRAHLPALLEDTPLMRLRGIPTIVDGLRPDLERHIAIMGGFTRAQKRRILPADKLRRFRDYDDAWHFRRYWRPELDLMSRLQYLDMKTYLPDDILTKVDRASMAVSLEVRPPLLDHQLVEYVAALPAEVRTPKGALKHMLKQVLVDLLPRDLLERPKKGFSVPLADWIARLGGNASDSPSHAFCVLMLRDWEQRRARSVS